MLRILCRIGSGGTEVRTPTKMEPAYLFDGKVLHFADVTFHEPSESLLNPKASSLTFYEKGAWALHILKELIGEEAFKTSVKNYLEKHKFRNVTTNHFLTEVKAVTTIDITEWEADWLQQSAFKAQQAYESLKRSTLITRYFEVQNLRKMSLADKKGPLLDSTELFDNDYLGQEIIYQLADEPISETLALYKIGFESISILVREAIALSLVNIRSSSQVCELALSPFVRRPHLFPSLGFLSSNGSIRPWSPGTGHRN